MNKKLFRQDNGAIFEPDNSILRVNKDLLKALKFAKKELDREG